MEKEEFKVGDIVSLQAKVTAVNRVDGVRIEPECTEPLWVSSDVLTLVERPKKPIEVGDIVIMPDGLNAVVLAIDGNKAWVRHKDERLTVPLDQLETFDD